MQVLETAWVCTLQVLAMLVSLGALVLLLAAEVWVGRNLVRGWRAAPGWQGFVNAASDMTHRTGIDEDLARDGAYRT